MKHRVKDTAYIGVKGDPVRLCARNDVLYTEAGWSWSGPLGGKMAPHHNEPRWHLPGYAYRNPDVRAVPADAMAALADFDRQIAEIMEARTTYIADHFRQWPLLRKEDVRIVPGKTKAEVVKEAKARA